MSGEKPETKPEIKPETIDRITADILIAAIHSKMVGTNTGSDENSAQNIAKAFLIIREAVNKNRG